MYCIYIAHTTAPACKAYNCFTMEPVEMILWEHYVEHWDTDMLPATTEVTLSSKAQAQIDSGGASFLSVKVETATCTSCLYVQRYKKDVCLILCQIRDFHNAFTRRAKDKSLR